MAEQWLLTEVLQLFDNRFSIANINSENGKDVLWTFLAKVIASLGTGGMIEDESSVEEPTECQFVVRIMDWRSAKLLLYLQVIDKARQLMNIFGKFPLGNAPRKRIRLPGGRIWIEKAIPGLPRNFYDDIFYRNSIECVVLGVVDPVIFLLLV